MTVVLVVLCVLVGGLELWAGKQSKDQARAFARRIDELRDEVGKQNGVLVTVGEQLTAELSRVKRDVLPGLDSRLRHNTGQIEQLGELLRQADGYLRAQAGRLQDLEQQRITLAALRRKLTDLESSLGTLSSTPAPAAGTDGRVDVALERLTELERSGTEIMSLQRDLTRTLENVEDVVADLLHYAGGELDEAVTSTLRRGHIQRADVLLSGRLWSRDAQLQDVLLDVYEDCLREAGLAVRFKTTQSPLDPEDTPERRRYFLCGPSLEDLVGGFTALLISTGTDLRRAALLPSDVRVAGARHPAEQPVTMDEAAFKALLRGLHETGGATAQIGPFFAVRTREELLCAVLTAGQSLELESDDVFWDPAAAAPRLRRMAAHQIWDLTDWAARVPAR